MVSVEQIEENISKTNIHKLLHSLNEGKEFEIGIQKDCYNLLRKEEERIKTDKKICKSGVNRYINYLKDQIEIHYQREVLYHALSQAIMNGDYVDDVITDNESEFVFDKDYFEARMREKFGDDFKSFKSATKDTKNFNKGQPIGSYKSGCKNVTGNL